MLTKRKAILFKEKETIGEHMKFGDLKLNQTDYKQLMLLAKIKNFERNHLFWLYYVKNFGLKQASKFDEYRKDRIIWLKMCEDWLIKNFSELVQEYKNVDVEFERVKALSNRTNHIWVCWLQGEENMPEIVKLCINSIRMHSPAHAEVTLITGKNLDQYLEFPDYVLKKVKEGKLSLTHFLDIVRFSLLEKYGGLWMDATMFLTDDIPDDVFQKPLWGIQLFNSM